MKHLLFFTFSLIFSLSTFAASLSNSGVELTYDYEVSFRTTLPVGSAQTAVDAYAKFHAGHVFGIFSSSNYAKQFGYDTDMLEGFAGTKAPVVVNAQGYSVDGDKYMWVHYQATGKFMVLKKVATAWLNGQSTGTVVLPLLKDIPAVYSDDLEQYRDQRWVKCTDEHYQLPGDFSYFYNPFRCPSLGRAPIAVDVPFHLQLVDAKADAKRTFPHSEIYGDNGNGPLTVLYYSQGYNDAPEAGATPHQIYADIAYGIFSRFGKGLVNNYGFTAIENTDQLHKALGADFNRLNLITPVFESNLKNRVFFRTFVKKTKDHTFVVRTSLANSDEWMDRPIVSFIKFWKEAWENGDFIYFGGHSGDGQSLDIDELNLKLMGRHLTKRTPLDSLSENDLNNIHFSPTKTQIAFFDACTSYDHYQDMYTKRKPQNLYTLTYGTVSDFQNAETTMRDMLEMIVKPQVQAPLWLDVMHGLEVAQLSSQLTFFYGRTPERDQLYQKYLHQENLPAFLINVSIPH